MSSLTSSRAALRSSLALAASLPAHWLIIAGGVVLRLLWLGAWPLWYDEASTALFARLPFWRMMAATAGDVHPPLYYIIEWLTLRVFGSSEFALRLPSVAFGALGLWLLWRVAQELHWPRAASLTALAFMAVSSAQVYYSQEARMYALFVALVLWATWAMLKRHWPEWCAALALMLWTHNYALFYGAVLGLVAFAREIQRPAHYSEYMSFSWRNRRDETQWQSVLAYGASAVALYVPWAFVLAGQMKNVAGGYWIQPVTAGSVAEAVQAMFLYTTPPVIIAAPITMLAVSLPVYVLWRVGKARNTDRLTLAMLAVGPLVLAVAVSLLWKPMLLSRALLPSGPAWYLLAGWAITTLPPRKQLYAALIATPIIIGALIGVYRMMPLKGITPELVADVRARWEPGDVIVYTGDGPFVTWGWYARDLPQVMVERCLPSLGGMSEQTITALDLDRRPLAQTPYRRAWIVFVLQPTQPLCQDAIAADMIDRATLVRDVAHNDYVTQAVYLKSLP